MKMTEQEKQEKIAEMAIKRCWKTPTAHTVEDCLNCVYTQACGIRKLAEALYNDGYQKIADNEVVIHKDGQNRTEDEIRWLVQHNAEVRKKAAKEILNELERTPHEYHNRKIKEIGERFGVEVEE